MRKGKDTDPYLWLADPDPDPGDPKNMRILRIRIPNTGRKYHIWTIRLANEEEISYSVTASPWGPPAQAAERSRAPTSAASVAT